MPPIQLPHTPICWNNGAVRNVFYLSPYFTVKDPQHASDRLTQEIISLKNDSPSAVDYFAPLLEPHIPLNVAIVVVPGHERGEAHGGLRDLAQRLCGEKRFDATAALVRKVPVQQSSQAAAGQRPTAQTHLDSITANAALLTGRRVWILDDVVTRGASLWACQWLVLDKNHGRAKSATLLALGRTIPPPPPPAVPP